MKSHRKLEKLHAWWAISTARRLSHNFFRCGFAGSELVSLGWWSHLSNLNIIYMYDILIYSIVIICNYYFFLWSVFVRVKLIWSLRWSVRTERVYIHMYIYNIYIYIHMYAYIHIYIYSLSWVVPTKRYRVMWLQLCQIFAASWRSWILRIHVEICRGRNDTDTSIVLRLAKSGKQTENYGKIHHVPWENPL